MPAPIPRTAADYPGSDNPARPVRRVATSGHRWLSGLRWLAALAVAALTLSVAACGSIPESDETESTATGQALFEVTAHAHGREAFMRTNDINVAYDSIWYSLVQSLQPVLVDAAFRGGSQERLLPAQSIIGQTHTGTAGTKYVVRERGLRGRRVKVLYNDVTEDDFEKRDAAALVADAYPVFLLGPLAFLKGSQVFEDIGPTELDGRTTDRLLIRARPGLGVSTQDRFILYIDREDRLMRRVRFTIDGLESTQGAVVEVDVDDYVERGGIRFPTRFFERIRRPIPMLPAHRWSLLGIDLNRGYGADALTGERFTGAAAAPARPLER